MNRLRRSFLVALVAATLVPARAIAFDFLQAIGLKKKPPPKPSHPWGHRTVTNGSKGQGYNAAAGRLAGYDASRTNKGYNPASTTKGKPVR